MRPAGGAGGQTYGRLVAAHFGVLLLLSSVGALFTPLAQHHEQGQAGIAMVLAGACFAIGLKASGRERPELWQILGGFTLALSTGYLVEGIGIELSTRDAVTRGDIVVCAAVAVVWSGAAFLLRRRGWTLIGFLLSCIGFSQALIALHDDAPHEAYGVGLFLLALVIGHVTLHGWIKPAQTAGLVAAATATAGAVVMNAGESTGFTAQLVGLFFVLFLIVAAHRTRSGVMLLLLSLMGPVLLSSVLSSSEGWESTPAAITAIGAMTALIAADRERNVPRRLRQGGIYLWSTFQVCISAQILAATSRGLVFNLIGLLGLIGVLIAVTSARRKVLVVITALSIVGAGPVSFVGGSVLRSLCMIAIGIAVLVYALGNGSFGTPRPVGQLAAIEEFPVGAPLEADIPGTYAEIWDRVLEAVERQGPVEFADRAAGRISGSGLVIAIWQPPGRPVRMGIFGEPATAAGVLAQVASS